MPPSPSNSSTRYRSAMTWPISESLLVPKVAPTAGGLDPNEEDASNRVSLVGTDGAESRVQRKHAANVAKHSVCRDPRAMAAGVEHVVDQCHVALGVAAPVAHRRDAPLENVDQ